MQVPMTRIAVLVLLVALQARLCADGDLISSMDQLGFGMPKEKGRAELVDGREGKAVKFSFDAGSQSTFFTSNLHGTTNWDQAAGFSFWVKGDGSNHLAGLQFIYDDDYALRALVGRCCGRTSC